MRALRPHQSTGLSLLRRSLLSGKRRPMLQAPTGYGKTLASAHIIDGALRKGNRVLFVVPAVDLIDQTVEAYYHEGIRDVGVIQADHPMTDASKPVQIASVQTLMRRQMPDVGLAIIDEAHRWFEFYEGWFNDPAWANKPIIGMSATPWTKGLGKHYDDLIIASTTADLIDAGFLSPFKVFAPTHPDLAGVRTVAGDYHEGDLAEAMNQGHLVADVVGTWLAKAGNEPTLVFAVDRAHAKSLQEAFLAAGVAADYVDAFTPRDERRAIKKRFHSGATKVVCNVGCLTTGTDWDVRCISLCRPTKSLMLYVQMIGRGLRTAPGKDVCTILDHSDTTLRMGFVTDIHRDALDDGTKAEAAERKAKDEPKPKECPQCHFVRPPKLPVCPACGHKAERTSEVVTEDGELIEITGKPARKLDAFDKARLFGQLKGYARQHGYSDGWAAHKFREATGVWPNHYKNAPEEPITPEVADWIKSRQIAFAKRRAA